MKQIKEQALQQRDEITRLYREGASIKSIADAVGINYKTLTVYLMDWDLKKPGKTTLDTRKVWIINNYTSRRLSLEAMAKRLKVKPATINNALRMWHVPLRGFYRNKTETLINHKQDIIFMNLPNSKYSQKAILIQERLCKKLYEPPYLTSTTTTTIAERLGMDKTTVKARLVKLQVPIRGPLEGKALRKVAKRSFRVSSEDLLYIHEREGNV